MAGLLITAGCGAALAGVVTASGPVSGSINGLSLAGQMVATADTSTGDMQISASGLPQELGPTMAWSFIHIIITRDAGLTLGGSSNMLSLTQGDYTRDVLTTFSTGDIMHVHQTSARMGPDALGISLQYDGTLPAVPAGSYFQPLDATESMRQETPSTVGFDTTRAYLTDLNGDGALEFTTANAHITYAYDGARQLAGDQTLRLSGLNYSYDAGSNTSTWRLNATVVPAPGPLALLGLGGLVVARRRR